MPKGPLSPDAKSAVLEGLAAPAAARNTPTRPEWVSATKMSPLGATRTRRGPLSPVAKALTAKPAGTASTARTMYAKFKYKELAGRAVRRIPLRLFRAMRSGDAPPTRLLLHRRRLIEQHPGRLRR